MNRTNYLRFEKGYFFYFNFNNENTFNLLNLPFNVFNFLPRNFKIFTANSMHEFNIEMLKDTSSVICNLLEKDPQKFEYHIDIIDEKNVMTKFEQLYQGIATKFNYDELFFVQQVIEHLNLISFPDILGPNNLRNNYSNKSTINNVIDTNKQYIICLSTDSLSDFLQNSFEKSFKIIINGKEYKCNIIGVRSSNKLNEIITKDPNLNQFEYEIEDYSDDFQLICNLFNFESIQITNNNMESLKQFAEDLQIECIIQEIDKFIKSYETAVQKISNKQSIIDKIDELFDLLYNRNNQTIEFVTNSIIDSDWSKTEDNVLELAAFILQVIDADYINHQFLIDLIINLDKKADKLSQFKIFIPTIKKQILNSFAVSTHNCAFIYRLYKAGFIQIDEILRKLRTDLGSIIYDKSNQNTGKIVRENSRAVNAILWFIPEIEEYLTKIDNFLMYIPLMVCIFIRERFYSNRSDYLKLRDIGEPDDSLTKAIINDDVDTLQKIISQRNDFSKLPTLKIPFNLYDSFILNGETTYINYAAYRGSLRCFKYLLLNNCDIDNYTFKYAVFGENYEIIRIVDQSNSEIEYVNQMKKLLILWIQ